MTQTCLLEKTADHVQVSKPSDEGSLDDVMDLKALYARCMGNLNLMERVLDKFEKRLPEELAELEQALQLHDAATIAQLAHRIKGTCSNVSAGGLRQAAEEIEYMGHAGRVADNTHLANLRRQWRRYIDCRPALRASAAGKFKCRPQTGP